MRITNIAIEHFRGAGKVSLPNVGAFNVIIGKNNSGKSTVLFALEAFYQALRADGLITLDPPFGRPIDFHRQDTSREIVIAVTFAIDPDDRNAILEGITSESPHLRTLTDNVEENISIRIDVGIVALPSSFSYVKAIRFSSHPDDPEPQWRTLLDVELGAAKELASRQRKLEQANRTSVEMSRFLESFDSDDFSRARTPDGRSYLNFRFNRLRSINSSGSSQTVQLLEPILRSSETYAEFRSNISTFREQLIREARSVNGEPLKHIIRTFSGEQVSVPNYVMGITRRAAADKLLYLTEKRDPVGEAEAKQLLDYKVTRGGPEMLSRIQSKIEKLLAVKVDAFESTGGEEDQRDAEMDVDNFLLEVNGSGIREALRLILDVELKKPTILLVEEPEVHLHPALETNMMRYLREVSSRTQVFISTHSTNFLDSANSQNVYFVSKSAEGSCGVRLLNTGEAEEELPGALGIRLSSLFMYDRLVFVEGLSDEMVLREFATILGVNLSEANVGFIHTGGSRNFGHFANQTTFTFLSKRQVKSIFVIDRDERSDDEIKKMREQLGPNATLHVLGRRELEKYLFNARPLAQFISTKRLSSGSKDTISQEQVQAALQKKAESLRPLTIIKRVSKQLLGSVHVRVDWTVEDTLSDTPAKIGAEVSRLKDELTRQEAQAATVLANAQKAVEGNWPQQWSTLVLGDELLDAVCKEFGARFRKASDGPNLAKLYIPDEIIPELRDLIRTFTS